MSRWITRAGTATAAAIATAMMAAGPAAAATTTGTSTSAKASSTHVKPGKTFTISGFVRHGSSGLPGQTVVLYERSGSKAKWAKATNLTRPSTKTLAKGAYSFTVTGLKHGEQYEVVHPSQKIGTKTYGRSMSKEITVSKA